jgi:hypothetical protein
MTSLKKVSTRGDADEFRNHHLVPAPLSTILTNIWVSDDGTTTIWLVIKLY